LNGRITVRQSIYKDKIEWKDLSEKEPMEGQNSMGG
jgi:hypothetical protein